jgi:hypothetical protein
VSASLRSVNSKHPKVEPIRQPTLFELEKPPEPASCPFSLPGIFLGTSSFTATGWEGSFYPLGMRSKDFLRHYASQFQTVEIDSTVLWHTRCFDCHKLERAVKGTRHGPETVKLVWDLYGQNGERRDYLAALRASLYAKPNSNVRSFGSIFAR